MTMSTYPAMTANGYNGNTISAPSSRGKPETENFDNDNQSFPSTESIEDIYYHPVFVDNYQRDCDETSAAAATGQYSGVSYWPAWWQNNSHLIAASDRQNDVSGCYHLDY
jgi:hypothetical protein